MTIPLTDQPLDLDQIEARSLRPVIEHALTDYGYSPDTARALVDQLLAEGGDR